MREELEQRLFKKYKRLFKTQIDSSGNAVAPLVYGIECQDGWYILIDRLLHCISEHVESSRTQKARDLRFNRALKAGLAGNPSYLYNYFQFGIKTYKIEPWVADRAQTEINNPIFRKIKEAVPQVVVSQIKEKYGGLRFYYTGGDEYISGLVTFAESVSNVTCELCGSPGTKNRSGWVRVLCQSCKNKDQS